VAYPADVNLQMRLSIFWLFVHHLVPIKQDNIHSLLGQIQHRLFWYLIGYKKDMPLLLIKMCQPFSFFPAAVFPYMQN
jgi:hypothetical protein